MNKNIVETIAAIIMEDMHVRSNTPLSSMKELSRTERFQAFRRIAGITATVNAFHQSMELLSPQDFHPIVANEFLQNRESFETLMDVLVRDGELEGEFAHIIGTFTLDVFIPIMCEFEDVHAEEEIEIIAQVFMLINMLFEEDVLHIVLESCFTKYNKADVDACDRMSAQLLEILEHKEEKDNQPINAVHTMGNHYENHKEFIVDAIVNYGKQSQSENETKTVQRLALYLAVHAEDVDLIKDKSLSEFSISHPVGLYFTDNHEDIHALCEEIQEMRFEHENAARNIIRHVNNHLEKAGNIPAMQTKADYVKHIYEIFHMLRIICIIRQRQDILNGLKLIFTEEEKERFSSYVSFLNIITLIDIQVE